MLISLTGCGRVSIVAVLLLLSSPAFGQVTETVVSPQQQRVALIAAAPEVVFTAVPDPSVLDQIVLLLSGYEYFPTASDLTDVTADPVPYLLTIAYDSDGRWLPSHHHRALGALAYYPTDTCRTHLLYLLENESTPELMRHHVINALAIGFGDSALADLEPFLTHDDLQLRLTAVAAIGARVESSRSIEILQHALTLESHTLVQERIERVLVSEPQLNPH